MDLLPERLAWFIAGPALGLLVVAFYAVGNKHLGVSRGYLAVVTWLPRPRSAELWRLGLILGSLLAAFLRKGPSINLDYGAASIFMPLAVLMPLLFWRGSSWDTGHFGLVAAPPATAFPGPPPARLQPLSRLLASWPPL